MTQIQPPQGTPAPPEKPPARPGPRTSPSSAVAAPGAPSTGRLVGVDLARALAVFGMYIVHIGPVLSATHGAGTWVRYLADGHSSVLFATLAGFSLMLIAGRREPKTGLSRRPAWPAGRRRPGSRSAPWSFWPWEPCWRRSTGE